MDAWLAAEQILIEKDLQYAMAEEEEEEAMLEQEITV